MAEFVDGVKGKNDADHCGENHACKPWHPAKRGPALHRCNNAWICPVAPKVFYEDLKGRPRH